MPREEGELGVCPFSPAADVCLVQLSCDRDWPCQRCVKTGRAHLCIYDSQNGQPPTANQQPERQRQASPSNHDEVPRLRAEVEQLRSLLSKQTGGFAAPPTPSARCPRLNAQSNNSKMRFPLGEFINHRITRRIEPHAYTMLSIACSNSLSRYIPACGSLCHTFPA